MIETAQSPIEPALDFRCLLCGQEFRRGPRPLAYQMLCHLLSRVHANYTQDRRN